MLILSYTTYFIDLRFNREQILLIKIDINDKRDHI